MANTIQHGVNITANDVKDLVESGTDAAGRKTWQDLYGSSALSYQAQNDALLKSYGDIIAEAYKSSLQQQNALYDFGLSANDTHDLRSIARQDMLAAYDSYLGQYQQAQQEIAEAYQTQKSTWDQALTDESTNFANLYNYAMQYYNDVLKGATTTRPGELTFTGEGKEAQVAGQENIISSLVNDYNLGWMQTASGETDENGNPILRDLTKDELMSVMFDADNNITQTGRNFYDMILNGNFSNYIDSDGNQITSFDDWLSKNDSDLYTWVHSPDTFNYTHAGTKLGTAKSFLGLESTDSEFTDMQSISQLEDYLTNNTWDKYFGDISSKSFKDIGQKISGTNNLFKYGNKNKKTIGDALNILNDFDQAVYFTGSGGQKNYNEMEQAQRQQVYYAVSAKLDAARSYASEISNKLTNTLKNSVDEKIYKKYEPEIKALLNDIKNYSIGLTDEELSMWLNNSSSVGSGRSFLTSEAIDKANAAYDKIKAANAHLDSLNIERRISAIIQNMLNENNSKPASGY